MTNSRVVAKGAIEPSNATPLTTLTLFGYPRRERLWAFLQMGLAQRALTNVHGLRFWKLLGSGHGRGFSLQPNWGRYGLFAVWETQADADTFFASAPLMAAYRRHTSEIWTIRLWPVQAHGAWSGVNPFLPLSQQPISGPVAILTRAAIHTSQLINFWRAVPATSQAIEQADGLLASIGIGEAPFIRQATFSLWRSVADVQKFAYGMNAHRAAIQRTRAENWYCEELFARFVPVSSEGSWQGRDPLRDYAASISTEQ
ncbi:hypothetical protein BH10CHL1_BH10CHL1_37820 [soil metagenome]